MPPQTVGVGVPGGMGTTLGDGGPGPACGACFSLPQGPGLLPWPEGSDQGRQSGLSWALGTWGIWGFLAASLAGPSEPAGDTALPRSGWRGERQPVQTPLSPHAALRAQHRPQRCPFWLSWGQGLAGLAPWRLRVWQSPGRGARWRAGRGFQSGRHNKVRIPKPTPHHELLLRCPH